MRATLNIPDDLLAEVQRITREKSKTKAIISAMEGFIRQKKMEELIALRGNIRVDYNWEKEEKSELNAQRQRERILGDHG